MTGDGCVAAANSVAMLLLLLLLTGTTPVTPSLSTWWMSRPAAGATGPAACLSGPTLAMRRSPSSHSWSSQPWTLSGALNKLKLGKTCQQQIHHVHIRP
jgi:hypothetical protein